jgi:hypothetical protein
MTQEQVKAAIQDEKLICPECKKPIRKFDKYSETIDSVRDGFNVIEIDSRASRVTLICANDNCSWKERTEYWTSFLGE